MRYVLVALGMILGFIFLPWWGTYALAIALLSISHGSIPLIFVLALDSVNMPFGIPYLSLSYGVAMVFVYLLKQRLFDGVV